MVGDFDVDEETPPYESCTVGECFLGNACCHAEGCEAKTLAITLVEAVSESQR